MHNLKYYEIEMMQLKMDDYMYLMSIIQFCRIEKMRI